MLKWKHWGKSKNWCMRNEDMNASRKKDSREFEVEENNQSSICEWPRQQESLKEDTILPRWIFSPFPSFSLQTLVELSSWGNLVPSSSAGDICQWLEISLIIIIWGISATGIVGRDQWCCQHHTVCKDSPTAKDHPVHTISSSKAGKSCCEIQLVCTALWNSGSLIKEEVWVEI